MNRKVACILAGGKGIRLWPLSRQNYPKQFVEFKDGLSLFQLTLQRILSIFPAEDVFIITHGNYKFTVYNQIELLKSVQKAVKNTLIRNIILEPAAKNTLPAILLSLRYLEQIKVFKNDETVYVFPSDHIIEPLSAFRVAINKAQCLARKGKIVIFGLRATSPQQAYGYILARGRVNSGFLVKRFIEKPTYTEAKSLIKKRAFWNAGIFCFSKEIFLAELNKFQPALFKYFQKSYPEFIRHFKSLKEKSIDYGIMQQTKNAILVRPDLHWSDLGTWDSFFKFYTQKETNFHIGKAEFLKSRNCFVYSGQRLICLVGLRDIIAIDSPDALLLIKKGYSDKVKELISIINRKGYIHSQDSTTVYRPWGYYTVLHEARGYKVKEIGIYPNRSLSLQKHRYRSEHWNVVDGTAHILIDGKKMNIGKNESVFVPKGHRHKISNLTQRLVKIIEVQIGFPVKEGDIVRYDSYTSEHFNL